MHFFPLPRLSTQVQSSGAYLHILWLILCKNNLGIVTDVIRKMIKQALFSSIVRSFTPSPAGWGNTGTVVAFPAYTKMFISRRVW